LKIDFSAAKSSLSFERLENTEEVGEEGRTFEEERGTGEVAAIRCTLKTKKKKRKNRS
jgi:hypothetical protein